MRQLFIILIVGTFLTGCAEQRDQFAQLVLDDDQITWRDVHQYTFDKNGKILVDRRTSYNYMEGVSFDSVVTETVFTYNNKGQLISAIDLPDSSRQIKMYNHLDSLVGDYRINAFGDTTFMAEIIYGDDGVVRRINRTLSRRLPDMSQRITDQDLRQYDTMLFIADHIYENNLHVKSLSRDKTGVVSEEIEFHYDHGKRVKSITYVWLGDARYIKQTTYYENTKDNEPDFVSMSTQGDTVAYKKTSMKSDGSVVLNYNSEFDMQDISYYDKKGQLIAIALVDVNAGERTVSKYTYDAKGNKTEEITFRGKLK